MNTGLPGYYSKGIPAPRVFCHYLTEVTEVPSKGMGILQNLLKLWYGYESVTELTEVPGIVARAYKPHRTPVKVQKCCTPVPRIFVARAYRAYRSSGYGVRELAPYRTCRSSGYGYECPTELAEVLCRVIPGVNTPGMVL